jgi:hypothetical protein
MIDAAPDARHFFSPNKHGLNDKPLGQAARSGHRVPPARSAVATMAAGSIVPLAHLRERRRFRGNERLSKPNRRPHPPSAFSSPRGEWKQKWIQAFRPSCERYFMPSCAGMTGILTASS